jgi:hypothetical protein
MTHIPTLSQSPRFHERSMIDRLQQFVARPVGGSLLLTMMSAAALPSALRAQEPPTSPSGDAVPLRKLAPAEARAKEGLTAASMVRALSDGSVIVNDAQRRRVVLFSRTMQEMSVIADTVPGAPIPYGQRPLGLLPYAGDSTILVDPATLSFVLLDPAGRQVRVMAPPRTGDINALATTNLGSNAFDSKGRLIYRAQGGPGGGFGGGFGGPAMMMFGGGGGGRGGGGGGGGGGQQQRQQGQQGGGPPGGFGGGPGGPGGRGFNPGNQPDSVPILRADFDTRKADTVTWVKVPRTEFSMSQTESGGMRMTAKLNPLPQADDWALLSDGTVAVVRVLDYHVDYYAPDGTHTAGPRLPFDWKRITDDDKTKLIDSLKTVAKEATERVQQMMAGGGPGGRGFNANFEPVEPERLPDYYPPIRAGTTLADRDGNLWILPSTSSLAAQLAQQFAAGMGGMGGRGGFGGPPGAAAGARRAPGDSARAAGGPLGGGPPGGLGAMMGGMMTAMMGPFVYDVVNRKGELVERVQLPPGRQLAGFGPNGVIYLTAREGRDLFLERTRRESN